MNFLAHLHLAQHCQSSLLGNLLGDFVKGDPQGRYPESIVKGIHLHRFVDAYTDQHPVVQEVKSCFPGESRRFAPIGLDLFWDHCLARRWHDLHHNPLDMFCQDAQGQIEQELTFTPPESFMQVHRRMWQGRWLESYVEFDNIAVALQRMSHRSPRMQALSSCTPALKTHYAHLYAAFAELYPQVLAATKTKCLAMARSDTNQ